MKKNRKQKINKNKKRKDEEEEVEEEEEDYEDFEEEVEDEEVEEMEEMEEDEDEEIGFMQKYKLTPTKLGKIIILIAMLMVITWLLVIAFDKLTFSSKLFSKVFSGKSLQEFSAPDEQSWRSFYYYKEMQKMARENIADNKKFDLPLAMNHFGDITFSELLGLFKVVKSIQKAKGYNTSLAIENPKQNSTINVDPSQLIKPYNYSSYFRTVANQYQCASCYSFPITATVQYLYKKHYNISIKLSEQQLIDCSSQDDLIDGCKEGNITKGFLYVQKIGLVQEKYYPYRSKGGNSYPCRKEIVGNQDVKKYKIDGFRTLAKENCEVIQAELAQGNTVATMMALEPGQLSSYRWKDNRAFRNCPKQPFNHAITIVGQTSSQDWIIRNSWGVSFGRNGYFILKKGNTCGVCTYPIVPYLLAPV